MADNSAPSASNTGSHRFSDLHATNSSVIQGNVYIGSQQDARGQELDEIINYGLCLASAPVIDPSYFVGRAAELEQMSQVLQPGTAAIEQRRLVLGGIGGMGKTQLALAYARLYHASYTSVFWLNATTDLTLKEGFRQIAQRFLKPEELDSLQSEQFVSLAMRWLSDRRNTQWLLIYDNHDDPDQFDINEYVPNTAHGSAIFTTRLPDLVKGHQVRLHSINDLKESLEILRTRSQRSDIENDIGARRLAERLAGLPLALATAGAYLRKTTITFEQYFQAYEQRFDINPRRPTQLKEYQDRTLYSTWNLTYSRMETDDPLAVKALEVLAYFDNQEIWFELLHSGVNNGSPSWLREIAGDHIDFQNVMATLVEYCLLEAHPAQKSYSMHSCVHDWILARIKHSLSEQLYVYAMDCIVANIDRGDVLALKLLQYARIARHGLRCAHPFFQRLLENDELISNSYIAIWWIAELLAEQLLWPAAEQMFVRALAGMEMALEPDHKNIPIICNNLGLLYCDEGKYDEAKLIFERVLAGERKAKQLNRPSILKTVSNLGYLYLKQGKLDEAEQMYEQALTGIQKELGTDHPSTLASVHNLGELYHLQGKVDKSEQFFKQALAGREEALGSNNPSTLLTLNHLGNLYASQGKVVEAEQMYARALAGRERVLGPKHIWTIDSAKGLARIYRDGHRFVEAERIETRYNFSIRVDYKT